MNTRTAAFVSAVLLLAPAAAWTADKDGDLALYAWGCDKYSAALSSQEKSRGIGNIAMRNWVSGYITAYNTWTPDTYDILGSSNVEDAMKWLENWCKANPTKGTPEGMSRLVEELYLRRHRVAKDAGQ